MGDRTRRAFIRGGRYLGRPLIRDDDRRRARRFSASNDGSQISRIGDVVEHHDKRRLLQICKHVRERGIGKRQRLRHDALMVFDRRKVVHGATAHRLHGDMHPIGTTTHLINRGIALKIVGYEHSLYGHSRTERFYDGVFPLDILSHEWEV